MTDSKILIKAVFETYFWKDVSDRVIKFIENCFNVITAL